MQPGTNLIFSPARDATAVTTPFASSHDAETIRAGGHNLARGTTCARARLSRKRYSDTLAYASRRVILLAARVDERDPAPAPEMIDASEMIKETSEIVQIEGDASDDKKKCVPPN